MTHEELRALLPRYAAGQLEDGESEVVRSHIATGCADCLREVFRHPMGLPRDAEPSPTPGAPAPTVLGWQWQRAVGALGLVVVALGTWVIVDLRGRETRERERAERLAGHLADADAQRTGLAASIRALESDLVAARAEAARQADAVRTTAEESAELRGELELARERVGVLTRGLRRRDAEIDRLAGDTDAQQALRELAATPGTEMLRLDAVAPFRDTRGHVLWHPSRNVVLLYAFDLPPLRDGSSYRVRVRGDEGHLEVGQSFSPGPHGDVVVTIRLGGAAARLREVEVLVDPSAEPVLAGRRTRKTNGD